MGIHDTIKELDEMEVKEETAEVEAPEEKEEVEQVTPPVEQVEPTKEETTDEVENPAEEVEKEEPTKAQKDDTFARLRLEKAAEKRRADELQAELDKANQPESTEEPDEEEDPDAHMKWELDETRKQVKELSDWKDQQEQTRQNEEVRHNAIEQFTSYEDNYKANVSDYNAVTSYGVQQIANSISRLRPDLKGVELGKVVQNQVLRMAGQAESQGLDPAEHFYTQSKEWGYKEPAKEEKEEKPKPDLKSIAKNKKKSPSSLSAGGDSGKPVIDKEAFATMKFSELARLSPQELRELDKIA